MGAYIQGIHNGGGVVGGRDGYPEGEIAEESIFHRWASSQTAFDGRERLRGAA